MIDFTKCPTKNKSYNGANGKKIAELYRKLSNKDIPPARTGCGMSFEVKNREKGTIRL